MQKTKTHSRLLALLLAMIMVLGLVQMTALAALDGDQAVAISLMLQMDDSGFVIAKQIAMVEAGLAETYGYSNDPGIGTDEVTALDAIVAAHIMVFGDDPGDVNNALAVASGGFLTNFMGDGSGNFVYFVNGVLLEVPAGETVLQDGDVVQLFAMQDTSMYADTYAWFEYEGDKVDTLTVAVDEDFDLTVMGTRLVIYGDWGAYDDIVDGAGIVTVDSDGAFVTPPIVVTDDDGMATLSFDTPGTYILSAIDWDSYMEFPLMSPWLVITVISEPEPGDPVDLLLALQIDDSGFAIAKQTATIEADLSERYGYIDDYNGEQVTALDAIVAAHIMVFGDDPGDVNNALAVASGGFLTNFMGDGSGNFVYFVNGVLLEVPAGETVLQDCDVVQLFAMQDTSMYADTYAWFEYEGEKIDTLTIGVDEDFDLTIMGTWFVIYGDWGAYDDVVDGAGIVTVDSDGTFVMPPIVVTDDDGMATLSFDTPGTYILSAVDWDSYMEFPLMSPWLELIVTESQNPPDVTLTGITITSGPDKTVYTAGDVLDTTGLIVTATYSDGSTSNITGDITNPANGTALNTAGTITVTVSYQGKTATFTVTVNALPPVQMPYETALSGALGWIRANTTAPTVGSTGGEWAILALARADVKDDDWNAIYLAALDTAISGGNLELTRWTDYQRVTLALTALGLDASDYNGHDLTEIYKTYIEASSRPSNSQTINAEIFALIALNSKPYSGGQQQYVDRLLEAQLAGGGWNLPGTSLLPAVVDITAMSVQALAPYYNDNADVKAAVDSALVWLNGQTVSDAEDLVQIIVAFSALDIDAADYVDALLGYYDEATSGFKRSNAVNAITTEQAAYALVAYDRYKNDKNSLYDMSDAGDGTITIPVNKAALNEEIVRADALSAANYTVITWNAMQTALTTAKTVAANENATQIEVDNAITALTTAIAALVAVGGGQQEKMTASISVDNSPKQGQPKVYFEGSFEIGQSDTVYSLLVKTGLTISISGNAAYGLYVEAIDGFGEFDDGPLSGWMYKVNGTFPEVSPSNYVLKNGDRVEWVYTRNLGNDTGGGNSTGNGNNNNPNTNTGTGTGNNDNTKGEVEPKIEDGTAVAEVKPDIIKGLIDEAKTKGKTSIAINVTGTGGVNSVELSLTVESVNDLVKNGIGLTVQSGVATILFDTDTLKTIAYGRSDEKTVTIITNILPQSELDDNQREIIGDNPVIDLSVWAVDTQIHNFSGTITVSIPYTPHVNLKAEDYDLLTVYYLDADGNIQEMKGAKYDTETETITFTTSHSSVFFISEWVNPFKDVARNSWYYKSVRFAYSESLMVGTGNNNFAPETTLTRAMLVQILYNNEGKPATNGGMAFTDVRADAWYADAIAWASANGVAAGYGDGLFGPGDEITREQLVTMLYNYAQWKGYDISRTADLSKYADNGEVADWAKDAFVWVVAEGLVAGRTLATLVPKGTATRAEAATLLQRFIESITDALEV